MAVLDFREIDVGKAEKKRDEAPSARSTLGAYLRSRLEPLPSFRTVDLGTLPKLTAEVLTYPSANPSYFSLDSIVQTLDLFQIGMSGISLGLDTPIVLGPVSFADRLKELRLISGLTQDELASKTKVSKMTISQYETGRRLPSIGAAAKIAKALGGDLSLFSSVDFGDTAEE